MSYCVNCGVELGESEKRCPLCGVEVINPAKPYSEKAERPFPASAESVTHRGVRIITAKVLSLLLVIPTLSVLIADLLKDGRLSWSLLPVAAMGFVFLAVIFPCLLKKPPVWLFILLGTVETAAFLFVVWVLVGGDWLWLFALPLTALVGAAAIGCYLILRSKRASVSLKIIVVLLILMVFVIVLQMLIELHLSGRIRLSWSIYAALSCGMVSLAVLIVSRLIRKNESIRKKLFF